MRSARQLPQTYPLLVSPNVLRCSCILLEIARGLDSYIVMLIRTSSKSYRVLRESRV